MEPVLGLVEDHAAGVVEDGLLDLLARVGGEAVHEERVGLGGGKEFPGDRIGAETAHAFGRLVLLAHAGPDIGIDEIGSGRGLERVGRVVEVGGPAAGLEKGADLLAGFVVPGPGQGQPHAEEAGSEDPGVGHVEPGVAEECDLAALERREEVAPGGGPPLGRREGVGVDLAGVKEIGEPVDDGNAAGGGEPLDVPLVEGAHDQAVHEARQHPGRVLDGLAPAQLDVVPVEE